ncbi:MAG: hypothetical protein WCF57_20150 [Pyrinomonadaceae bacterium]
MATEREELMEGLLRSWRTCMAEPRPSDWEQIVVHLLEDTEQALDAQGDVQKGLGEEHF